MTRTVLIADDDAEVRALLAAYLEQRGCQVREADSGVAALRELNASPPDVLLLDLMMPRLGGLSALRLITPAHPRLRVIVITGTDDPALRSAATSLGAYAVVAKPLDLPALGRLIESALVADRPMIASDRPLRRGERETGRSTILIVDDDEEMRETLREVLEANGYSTRVEQSAAGAFWALMQEMPDAVLLDISMPGLSGIDVIPALRFVKQDVKIIMVSGVSDLSLAKQSLAYGAFDYVTKPVDFARLLEAVRAAVDSAP